MQQRTQSGQIQELYRPQRWVTQLPQHNMYSPWFIYQEKGKRDRMTQHYLSRELLTQKMVTPQLPQHNMYSPCSYKHSLAKYKSCIDHRDGSLFIYQEKRKRDRMTQHYLSRPLLTQKMVTPQLPQHMYSPCSYKHSLAKYKSCIDHRDGSLFIYQEKRKRDRMTQHYLSRPLLTQKMVTPQLPQHNMYSPCSNKHSLAKYKNCIDHRDGSLFIYQENEWDTDIQLSQQSTGYIEILTPQQHIQNQGNLNYTYRPQPTW